MQSGQLARSLKRMSMQVVEDLKGSTDILILGLNSRGFHVAQKLAEHISAAIHAKVPCESLYVDQGLDDTCTPMVGRYSYILLVDDVLFSGTTMMRAIRLVLEVATPGKLRVAVVIDRGHRKYPVQPDFLGLRSPTKFREHVEVEFDDKNYPSSVVLTEL
jgi:pyrimidine operon attenuation protein / uracil phosphoribosyltransferase